MNTNEGKTMADVKMDSVTASVAIRFERTSADRRELFPRSRHFRREDIPAIRAMAAVPHDVYGFCGR